MPDATLFEPDWVSPPGDTIADILEERGITHDEFSRILSISPEAISELIDGTLEIYDQLAMQLSQTLGASADFWHSREANFRASLDRLENQVSDTNTLDWIQQLPVADMANFGWIRKTRKRTTRISECFRFFGIGDVSSWESRYHAVINNVAFRTSSSFDSTPSAVAAWLRHGEIEASKMNRENWNADLFYESLFEIRNLSREQDPFKFIPALQRLCAQAGVSVVVTQSPKGCKASGATRFIAHDHPVLMLSGRHLSDDHFWFTFFHEAGHLILHGHGELFLEFDPSSASEKEVEANIFAQNILIPRQHREEFLQLKQNKWQVVRFARNIGTSAGIIVGQLQHQEVLDKRYLNGLKRRYMWVDNQLISKS